MFVLACHRAAAHAELDFEDRFVSSCECARTFATRASAANHERGCSSAGTDTARDLSPRGGRGSGAAAPSGTPEPNPPTTTMSTTTTTSVSALAHTDAVEFEREGAKRCRLSPPHHDGQTHDGADAPPPWRPPCSVSVARSRISSPLRTPHV